MALMVAIASFTLAVAILWLSWEQALNGLRACGCALFVHGLALLVLALRDRIPEPLALVTGYTLLSASYALMTFAVCSFQQLPASRWLTLAPIASIAIGLLLLRHEPNARTLFGGPVLAFQCAVVARSTLRLRQSYTGHGHQLLATGAFAAAAIYVVRAVSTGMGWIAPAQFASSNALQAASLAAALVSLLLFSLGFIGMLRERAEAATRRLALQDELTGIANRRSVLDGLARAHAAARRAGEPLCVLMIDLDHFKRVNDDFGHQAGDRVLKHVAESLGSRLRSQDILGRYGGEEFMAILPDTALAGGMAIAQELCARVRATEAAIGGRSIPMTVSIGVNCTTSNVDTTVDDLVRAADAALYAAKSSGRDRACAAPPAPRPQHGPAIGDDLQRSVA